MSSPLLPSGVYDILPPYARQEREAVATLLSTFEQFGYGQVSPPLMEFESSLLSGENASLAPHTFRVMDPLTQQMLAIRSDMTPQIARIATHRLSQAPRPLRLSYAGPALRVKAAKLRNERQILQAGAELIGVNNAPLADAEVMVVAACALRALGLSGVSIDIALPGLAAELLSEASGDAATRAALDAALASKDTTALAALSVAHKPLLSTLMLQAGPAANVLPALQALALPAHLRHYVESLAQVVAAVQQAMPALSLTIDPLEVRGFEYHTGIGFSLFAAGLKHEIGRGGRYVCDAANSAAPGCEEATGFTIYVGNVLRALPEPALPKRILLPFTIAHDAAETLRAQGFVTLHTTGNVADMHAEAKRLQCSHAWVNGAAVVVN